VKRIQKF